MNPLFPEVKCRLKTCQSIRARPTHYQVEFEEFGRVFDYDFVLYFSVGQLPLFTTLSYTEPDTTMAGFYLLWGTPPESFFLDAAANHDLLLCVDISASMIGTKLNQVKQAFVNILSQLNPGDRFNILAFNTKVNTFKNELVNANAANLSDASNFVRTLAARGLTDLNQAMVSALAMFDNPGHILVISDGEPTSRGNEQKSNSGQSSKCKFAPGTNFSGRNRSGN